MSPVSPDSSDAESELLLRLRATPEIFAFMERCTPAELASQKKLRAQFDDELVRAALSVHDARIRAQGKLPCAERLWLTRIGLEQSTAWEIACHKARRFVEISSVHDLCCGVGVDAACLAAVAEHVTAVDSSSAMCLRTAWNNKVWNPERPMTVQRDDVTKRDWTGLVVHADPDRRAGRDRPTKRLENYQPDLAWMQQLIRSAVGGAIKVGPASNFLQKFPGCEIELISLHGECREATVWFGAFAGKQAFRATSLSSGESLTADPLSVWTNTTPAAARFVFDPDPAIVRSGLLDVMAQQHGLLRLDAEEEYLTSDQVPATAFVTAFEIETVLPNSLKTLKQFLRSDASREYEIKCRRINTDADAVRRQLPAGDAPPRVIFFARISGRGSIIVAHRPIRADGS